MAVSRQEAFEMFAAAARRVWGDKSADFVLPHVSLSDEEPAADVTASLAYRGRPWAIGDLIARRAERYTLRVAMRLLDMDPEVVRGAMAHEAIHLGVASHGADFRALARRHGIPVSEHMGTGGRVQVQQKEGHRFRTVREFDDDREALTWMREQRRAGGRWRLSM